MRTTEQNAKTPTVATGFFATLRGLLRINGTGASQIIQGIRAPKSTRRLALFSLPALVLASLALTTATALAAPETPETGKANPASITATTVTLEDGVLNPHAALGELAEYEYRFRVSATECEGENATAGMAAGDLKEVVPPVELTNLQPNVEYTFCLFERSLATGETSAASPPAHFTTKPAPPEIPYEFSSEVSSTSATLNAGISPNNEATKYRFEYSKSATGETLNAPVTTVAGAPPAAELEGFEGQVITASTGAVLTLGTTYYYRVVAENEQSKKELKPAEGTVKSFTTVPTPHTDPVTAIAGTTATFNGDLTPLNPTVATTYHFIYNVGAACTGGSKTLEGDAGTGTGGASAATPVTDLQPDTIYTVCFVTSNVGEGSVPVTGAPVTFRTLPDTYVTDVVSSSVTLHAVLDPEGVAITYRFQYGPSSEYGSQTPEESVEASGAGGPVSVEVHLQELTPGSVYHYRVIASNAAHETFAGEDHTFTTLPPGTGPGTASVLADNRQYEFVSPPDKHGALVEPIGEYGLIESSMEGDAFTYIASAPTESQPQGNANASQILATRGEDGWSDRDIATPNESSPGVTLGAGQEYRLFSSDLSRSIFEARFSVEKGGFTTFPGEETSPLATEYTPYLRESFSCPSATCYTPLLTTTDVTTGAKYGEGANLNGNGRPADDEASVGATPDLSHVVLSVRAPLTKATSTTPEAAEVGLYEWTAGKPAAEQLQLVSVLPAAEGGRPAAEAFFGSTASGGDSGSGDGNETRNAISNDGLRIVWSSAALGAGGLYMRDTAIGETVRLDAVQGGSGRTPQENPGEPYTGDEQERHEANFDMASSDGSTVFFTDTQRLTADSRAGVDRNTGDQEPDLYACNMVEVQEGGHQHLKCDLTDLTPDGNPGEERAAVQGAVLGASEDGSYVYFVADGVLGDAGERGATTGNCKYSGDYGNPGETCNLYVEHYDGEIGKWEAPRFIATASGVDFSDWEWVRLGRHTSGASPDGHYLAFMSERDLTGYDSTDANSGEPDEQVYLYHAATNKLVCASCNPTSARPVGEEYGGETDAKSGHEAKMRFVGGYEVWPAEQWLAANIPGWVTYSPNNGAHQPRYLSNSGRLFFNSHDALVPQDVNGTWDVYQYEPPGNGGEGEGDCTTSTQSPSDVYDPQAEGCVGLISSGESSEESAFLDASESGGNVFFMTLSQLVPQDVDHSIDVYDAHECTSSALCLPAAAEVPPPCTTEASCKASPEPPPSIYGAPASATFSGPGNLAPPPPAVVKKVTTKTVKCKKGDVKKKVKKKETCVKKPKKKSKKSSKKKGK